MTSSELGVEVLTKVICFLKSNIGINSRAECLLSVFPHMNN
jgi:hypothetical protein